jgi:hypothetical protein
MADEPKSLWQKLALVTAFLTALGGLAAFFNSSGGKAPGPPQPPIMGQYCCDMQGVRRCPLVSPIVNGSPCFCPYQGRGIGCP